MTSTAPVPNLRPPLDGIRVVDLTQVIMGSSATQVLAEYGAEVIKVERPGTGEIFRSALPSEPGANSAPFASVNRNKRSVEIDPRSPEGSVAIRKLIEISDVIVNNYRPGVMDRLGLGYDVIQEINPRMIYAEATGFGPTGKYVHKGGQDILAQAYSGVMLRKADPSHPTAIYATSLADYGAGMHLAQGILLALLARDRNGVGQKVEVSLYDSMIALQHQEAAAELAQDPELNWVALPMTGVFPATDGQIVIVGAFKQNPLRDICQALDLEDLSLVDEYRDMESRKANKAALHELFEQATSKHSVVENLTRLEAVDILCAPVRSLPEALADDHTTPMLIDVEDAAGRVQRHVGSPIHLSDTPAQGAVAAPLLGDDNQWLKTMLDETQPGDAAI